MLGNLTAKDLGRVRVVFDEEGDMVDILPPPKHPYTIQKDVNGEFWIRYEPGSGKIVGFIIEDFTLVFAKKHPELADYCAGDFLDRFLTYARPLLASTAKGESR